MRGKYYFDTTSKTVKMRGGAILSILGDIIYERPFRPLPVCTSYLVSKQFFDVCLMIIRGKVLCSDYFLLCHKKAVQNIAAVSIFPGTGLCPYRIVLWDEITIVGIGMGFILDIYLCCG